MGLAQAIVHEPRVLILDEPTSSLDPNQRAEVRELIAHLKGDHTFILSTHILPEVSEVADRVFILNRGKVMAVDTPRNLGTRLQVREVVNVELLVPNGPDSSAGRQFGHRPPGPGGNQRPGPAIVYFALFFVQRDCLVHVRRPPQQAAYRTHRRRARA